MLDRIRDSNTTESALRVIARIQRAPREALMTPLLTNQTMTNQTRRRRTESRRAAKLNRETTSSKQTNGRQTGRLATRMNNVARCEPSRGTDWPAVMPKTAHDRAKARH